MAKETDRNIYKNGRYYHGRVKVDGWWKARSLGTDDIRMARKAYARLLAKALEGKPIDDTPEKAFDPLLDILRDYIAYVRRVKDEKAVDRYRNALVHIERHLGNPRVNTLTREGIEGYIVARLGDAAKPGTVQKEVLFLKVALNRAMMNDKGVLPKLTKGHKVPGGDKSRDRLLSKAEIDRLRKELEKGTILDHFLVALYTGMRKGELREMQMRDVDFQVGTISVLKTKNNDPKTVTMHRVVKEIMFRRRSDDPHHRPFHSPVNLNRPFNRAVKRAGLHDVRWHDLRRAMASHMLMAGSDISTVMKQGGWKTPSVLLKVYAQVTSEHIKQQVGRLDFEGETEAANEAGRNLSDNSVLEPCS